MAYSVDDYRRDRADDFLGDRVADHERVLEKLRDAHARLRNEVVPGIARISTYCLTSPLLMPWRDEIAEKLAQAINCVNDVIYRLGVLLVSGTLPIRLWRTAAAWTQIRGDVSAVAGDLAVTNREVHVRWRGAAADAYHAIIPAHAAAATRLGTVADSVQFALTWAATAAALFYAALLVIVLEAVAALLTTFAVAATVTGAVASVVMILMIVAALAGQLSALVVAATEAFGRLRIWLNEMVSEMRDNSAFPGGAWPSSRSQWYADATVTDGDADWSVRT